MDTAMPLRYSLLPDTYAIARLDPAAPVPPGVLDGPGFSTISRTADELSLVCPEARMPAADRVEGGWRVLRLHGPFAFDEVGILSALLAPLAAARIGIFAISTFDTDYLLVKAEALATAQAVLAAAGHVEVA
ncbi:ACT domain-containing protein [Thermomonas sp.]|uniref:ACT domain-containing protein n=1 Tax=Thermomonas sp. TaxID=1971895 RepID=UPI003919EEF2